MRTQIWAGRIAVLGAAHAVNVDISSPSSIKQAASTIAYGLVSYYTGNHTGDVPGLLPAPYYWWEAGAMFGSLINYWYYTGDDSYNSITTQAMLFQVGPDSDYMPPNQTSSEGNDDQGFWGMAAMTATEHNYPNPPPSRPQWLALAQAVFNQQASRWNTENCGGGLKWQIFTFNKGYNYRNTISNGCFFNLGARLARYTDNHTYADLAERTWNWVSDIGLMDADYHFYDGSDDLQNCTSVNHIEWSYNAAVFLHGAATMWNYTQKPIWRQRVQGILDTAQASFFRNGVMFERRCEDAGKCNTDQKSFKAYLARAMAATVKMAPFTGDTILPLLQSSAQAAAAQCSGTAGPHGALGNVCGLKWTQGDKYDGTFDLGQQLAALEVIQSNLIQHTSGPLTNRTGGTSKGNPAAGGKTHTGLPPLRPITTADRAGAAILTGAVLLLLIGMATWMLQGA